MSINGTLLEYLKEGVDNLLDAGQFENGWEFRPTQNDALEAYKKYLNSNYLKTEDKLKGFFDMPTGIGKTALFSGILSATHQGASRHNDHLKSIIVVPTITLLDQTHQDLKDFAPTFASRIGLYGDGHKNLHNQITIMTYDAWYDLSAAGKIGSHNVDILISDEAHKGTSERRIENIINQYDDKKTARIAFSATPHFDETKSVYATHGRQIFYRSIRDAVLSGELASYIQSHRAVIRAMPTEHMITKEFSESAFATKAQYRKRLRQEAWNKFAIKIFRDGVDEYTDDPLSDNQAGFFVDDTTQADNLAKMLNSDGVLQAKAKALGMSGVAVSIHSKNRRRKHQLSEYKVGKYMAIIGDEMFKEGFNHPPMKTIIDYAHGSVVDKGQILGRGAREWWNEKKQRYEGLVLIDTVAYIGSKTPTENMRLREAALKNAVSVKGILEDSFILGPRANISPQNDPRQFSKSPLNNAFSSKVLEKGKNNNTSSPSLRKPRPNIFWDNPDIEYYSYTAEVYQLDTEIAKINRDHWIEITEEMRLELDAEMTRAGVGAVTLFEKMDKPEGLDHSKIERWRYGGTSSADPDLFNLALNTCKMLPDAKAKIEITEEKRLELDAEMTRAGVGAVTLFEKIGKPEELTDGMIGSWRHRKTSSADPDLFNLALNTCKALPNAKAKIEITEGQRLELDAEMTRAGVSRTTLFEKMDKPEGLTDGIIGCWRSGITSNVDPDLFNLALNTCKMLPDAKAKIEITKEQRLELGAEMTRAGVSASTLFEKMGKPEELTDVMIDRWRNGITSSADQDLFNLALNTCKMLPDAKAKIEITEAKRLQLDAEMTRADVGATTLLKKMSKPEGIATGIINSWRKGITSSADQDLFNLALNACKALPDAKEKIEITEEKRLELDAEMTRADVGATTLFKKMGKPEGSSTGKIDGWRSGRTSSADQALFNLALTTCKALPTKGSEPDESSDDYDLKPPEP